MGPEEAGRQASELFSLHTLTLSPVVESAPGKPSESDNERAQGTRRRCSSELRLAGDRGASLF